jgi:signal peptidase I
LTEIIPESAAPAPVPVPVPEPEPAPTPAPANNLRRFLLDLLETVGLAVVLFLAINAISARVRVDGFSMRPTLENGEFVLVNRLAYRFGEPERGDIIVFRSLLAPEDLIKRVIGLPGDVVKVENGAVTINGITVNEPYIAASPYYSGTWEVPPGNLFVLGDNRNDSSDSHSWGFLPTENIVGKAVLVYWPFSNFMVLRHGNALASP